MIEYNALTHSWGTKPEQKEAEKEYNAEYYQKHKEKWGVKKDHPSRDRNFGKADGPATGPAVAIENRELGASFRTESTEDDPDLTDEVMNDANRIDDESGKLYSVLREDGSRLIIVDGQKYTIPKDVKFSKADLAGSIAGAFNEGDPSKAQQRVEETIGSLVSKKRQKTKESYSEKRKKMIEKAEQAEAEGRDPDEDFEEEKKEEPEKKKKKSSKKKSSKKKKTEETTEEVADDTSDEEETTKKKSKKKKKKSSKKTVSHGLMILDTSRYKPVMMPSDDELYHHGIRGQKWGVRRYQNADGSYTAMGKARVARANEERDTAHKLASKYTSAMDKKVEKLKSKGASASRISRAESESGLAKKLASKYTSAMDKKAAKVEAKESARFKKVQEKKAKTVENEFTKANSQVNSSRNVNKRYLNAYNKTAVQYNNGKIDEYNKKHKPSDPDYESAYLEQFNKDLAKNYNKMLYKDLTSNKHYKKGKKLVDKYMLDNSNKKIKDMLAEAENIRNG